MFFKSSEKIYSYLYKLNYSNMQGCIDLIHSCDEDFNELDTRLISIPEIIELWEVIQMNETRTLSVVVIVSTLVNINSDLYRLILVLMKQQL